MGTEDNRDKCSSDVVEVRLLEKKKKAKWISQTQPKPFHNTAEKDQGTRRASIHEGLESSGHQDTELGWELSSRGETMESQEEGSGCGMCGG